MTCWAVIPVKASAGAKSRLAGALAPGERDALVRAMLTNVVGAARAATRIDKVCLLGPSRMGQDESLELLDDPGQGLNPAVQSALAQVGARGPERMIVLFADLPAVTARELDLLAIAGDRTIAIAPDRHETGTNAISLPLPAASGFRFAYGHDSFARHKAEAERLGLELEVVLSRGLECDIDDPEDLPDAGAAFGGI